MHHWIWGCMLVFRQIHMSKWSEPWSCWNRAILLGDDPPPSLAGGLAIETSINSFSEHGAVCSNMFQHWGMLLRLVSPLFWNNLFWWILRVQTFWAQPQSDQSWLVANFQPISMEIQLYWILICWVHQWWHTDSVYGMPLVVLQKLPIFSAEALADTKLGWIIRSACIHQQAIRTFCFLAKAIGIHQHLQQDWDNSVRVNFSCLSVDMRMCLHNL